MKRLTTTLLACGALAVATHQAGATAQLRLSDGTAAGTITITDNDPNDANPAVGVINYSGPVGPNWTADITIGTSDGTPSAPAMDIATRDTSASAGTLTVDFSETDFISGGAATLQIGGISDGTVTYQVWTDPGNANFAKTTSVGTVGPLTPDIPGDPFSGSIPATISSPAPYSITMETVIQHPTAGTTGLDAQLLVTPPPCNCTLTFTSPLSITNNLGDVIPDVTAVEDCGSGPAPVTVTLLGAATNGTCPQIITRTNMAQDDCGDLFTNVQTVTVLCPPPCTCTLTFVTPSTLTLCASDVIPDVVAVENCGGGLSNTVPVTFLGASTNGSCPQIITRTNAAMDNCGDIFTNVQTITVNCRGNICGHIFADCDGSGDLTTGDIGLSNVVVTLLSSNNQAIATETTDANGGYCFTNLNGGSYIVSVTPPYGYTQTAASTSYHWKDNYGRTCWQENDGYIHCLSSGTECWWDKYSTCHWKDSYGRDCWKDNWGYIHYQPCSYQTCNAQTNNNKITVTLTNCTSKTDVDFAYTGTKSCLTVTCSAPQYVKCGSTYTYTCTVVNNGNVCFTGGKVCHIIGNCGGWGGWSNCSYIYDDCPPLSPGQKCTFTHKCTTSYWNYGTIGCQANVTCYSNKGGNCSGQSSWYAQCGW